MNIIFKHLKTHVFRGLLAIIPLVLSYFVIRFLYLTIDRKVAAPIENAAGFRIPGLGILLIILLLYLVGLAASNWLGKKAFNVIEWLSRRIPLIGTVYHLGKQLAEALSLPEKQSFKRVVLVEQFKPGVWTVGFVTGSVKDKDCPDGEFIKVFIPPAPNPTTGFMVLVKEGQVRDLPWTVQEAMNTIVSGGIIGPDGI